MKNEDKSNNKKNKNKTEKIIEYTPSLLLCLIPVLAILLQLNQRSVLFFSPLLQFFSSLDSSLEAKQTVRNDKYESSKTTHCIVLDDYSPKMIPGLQT